jgi:dolichyl-phosphate-mannose-protein mannosyltransferase
MSPSGSVRPPEGPVSWARRWPWLSGLVVAAIFFGLGLFTLHDFGRTWDEELSYRAGLRNLEILPEVLTARADVEWPWVKLTGYQYVMDTLRVWLALKANHIFGWNDDPILGFHLFHLVLATSTILFTFGVALELTGRIRPALLAAVVLATLPKFIAHSQSNPKDVLGLFTCSAAMLAGVSAARSGRLAGYLAAGAVAGLALTSHVVSLFHLPMLAAWILAAGRGTPPRRVLGLGGLLVATAAAAFLSWPWLWPAPWERLRIAYETIRVWDLPMSVLYLGTVYPHATPPLHYFVVSLAVATPLLLLVGAALGVATLARGKTDEEPGRRRLAVFASLWFGALAVAEAFATARYDGVRHLLAILPPFALLAATGLDSVLATIRAMWTRGGWRRGVALAGSATLVLAYVGTLAQLRAIHPYQDAYLNEAVNAAIPGHAEDVFELEYWAGTYKEGGAWLNEHVPGPAAVLAPFAPQVAYHAIDRRFTLINTDHSGGYQGPQYLMLITRKALYTPRIVDVRARLQPIFTIQRQKATLLEIYRLQ